MFARELREFADGHPIDSRSPFVGFDLLPGHRHVFTRQHALEQVERFWFVLQFRGVLRSPALSSAAWHQH
jgi:hypothetical protein